MRRFIHSASAGPLRRTVPAIFQTGSKPIVRRVVLWVAAVRKGKPDRKIINFPADFIPGGSIGPVWKG